ncbi:hypothetical protein FGO68_gene8761 [Halteria grandinella]|uniref:Fatty acid desaturase domain-containing protein n=1 Tax=Halteria grandinella TaxID=5974 RepID=A0A8J8T1I1_HALGN|nr:hypothetical protein FGO68_gene8761 [Halteria grandinella]
MGADGPEPIRQNITQVKESKDAQGASWADIAPFFASTFSIIGSFILLITGNISWVLWFGLVIVPIQDRLLAEDKKNVNAASVKSFEKDWRFIIPLLTGTFLDFALLIYILIGLGNGTLGASIGDFTILVISNSFLATSVSCIGHELYHRRNKFFKFLGIISHMKFLCGYIPIFHIEIHHKYTGIVERDHGYPPRGKSIYETVEFLGFKSFMDTYYHEENKLKKRGLTNQIDRLIANRVVIYRAIELLYLVALYIFLGWKPLIFQLLFAQLSLMILTTTNYAEHYGLVRKVINADKPNEKKIYEPQTRQHSWDTNAAQSNKLLFNLQRHSDHHLFVYKPYQILDSVENSPQLPFGYTAAFLCAWCWPLWKAVMHPMLDAMEKGEKLTEKQAKDQKSLIDKYLLSIWVPVTIYYVLAVRINIPSF